MLYSQPYGVSDPEAPYLNGNPTTGTMGSIPPAASIEFPQREIVAVIQYAHDKGLLDYTNTPCNAPSNGDLQQLLKAIFGMTNQKKLQADATLYINSSTGDDTLGDGSTAKPFLTYQKAIAVAQSTMDLNQQHSITFHGTGTFNLTSTIWLAGAFAGQAGSQSVVFDNTAATFHASNTTCFTFGGGAQAYIIGGTYQASWDHVHDSQGIAIAIGNGALVVHQGGTFNACDVAHFWVYGFLNIVGTYNIAGNAPSHAVLEPQSVMVCSSGGTPYPINCIGTPNFSNEFINCYGGSGSFGQDASYFSGGGTGKRYAISGYGTLFTGYSGPNFFPGNSAGSIAANTGNGEYT